MKLTRRDLDAANARFAELSPVEILRRVADAFGPRAAILSGMQRAGTILCHMADRAGLSLEVLFVDTGVMHRETLAVRDELARTHPNLRVTTLEPARTFAAQTREEGLLYLSVEGQARCCDLRKTEPLRGVRGKVEALVGALRQSEGGKRAKVQPLELDPEMNALRVHPLATWTDAQLDVYIRENEGVLVNPLHAMGFRTVGCFPCTTPVRPDEPDRAGRWRHLADVAYCGINPTDVGGRELEVEVPEHVHTVLSRWS
ncbi:MAG: phosphoadenylyl-sulfate reductase [Polyangiaceae bacterium]